MRRLVNSTQLFILKAGMSIMLRPHAPKRLGFLLQQCEMLQAVCVAPWSSPGERDVDGRGEWKVPST